MTNAAMLKGLIVSRGETQAELAEILHMNPTTLNQKINNRAKFFSDEMVVIKEHYGLSAEEFCNIFFAKSV